MAGEKKEKQENQIKVDFLFFRFFPATLGSEKI